ncbi:hypothetical protein [Pelistega suis]|uniref:Uncharacterized protein n=1 Tax=Pelistega suis TaxID=1631957 RepID=A0A849PC91_9BURK|nr:hypothetical protein [Pelistega suis]NOL52497.1 hypothetical protein [Pelistega suis]
MGRDFSDFLADIYHQRTSKELDKEALYQIFEKVHHTPLYLRTSQIQVSVRKLERKNLLASYGHGGWYINPPMFTT